MILFYVRHGDPIYKPDMLTPLGHRQAESVAKRLAAYGVDAVYSSTSTRAMQTAQPTCELLKRELKTLDWMHEDIATQEMKIAVNEQNKAWVWSHPVYSQILASREVCEMGNQWHEHPAFCSYHLERTPNRIRRELDLWLASLGYEHDREKGLYRITTKNTDKRIALFAHEGVGKVFMSELLDIPFPYYAAHFDMKHTGMTVIAFDAGRNGVFDGYARARVLTLSNDSHLWRDGLPTTHISSAVKEIY